MSSDPIDRPYPLRKSHNSFISDEADKATTELDLSFRNLTDLFSTHAREEEGISDAGCSALSPLLRRRRRTRSSIELPRTRGEFNSPTTDERTRRRLTKLLSKTTQAWITRERVACLFVALLFLSVRTANAHFITRPEARSSFLKQLRQARSRALSTERFLRPFLVCEESLSLACSLRRCNQNISPLVSSVSRT